MLIPLNSNKTLNIKNSAVTQNLHWAGVGGSNKRKDPESRARTSEEPAWGVISQSYIPP